MKWHIERLETCESTQDECLERARLGAPEGTAVIAANMQDGHGQHGRGWHAPTGGLYLSFVVRDVPPHLLTLALGNAVADVLEVAGADPQMKWVNDVWVEGKKIAGILVDGEATGDTMDFLVAGIGININGHAADWSHPLNATATTLEDVLGAESCIEDLETYLLQAINRWIDELKAGHNESVLDAWRARDALKGQTVGFDPDGDFCTKILGVAGGIDDQGHLIIKTDDGEQRHAAGSVFLQEERQTPK